MGTSWGASKLENGTAVVTMDIDNKYAPLIHPDATLLLRPRTGLQDMTIEIDPGTDKSDVKEGATIPLAQTQPNVQPDQILASLDADTRSYLQLLLQAAGQGLRGQNGPKLAAGLQALRAHRPRPGEDRRGARQAAQEPAAGDHELRSGQPAARPQRHPARRIRPLLQHRARRRSRTSRPRSAQTLQELPATLQDDPRGAAERRPVRPAARPRIAAPDPGGAGVRARDAPDPAAVPPDRGADPPPDPAVHQGRRTPLRQLKKAANPLTRRPPGSRAPSRT